MYTMHHPYVWTVVKHYTCVLVVEPYNVETSLVDLCKGYAIKLYVLSKYNQLMLTPNIS